jgi:ferric-dicitrate binding protein FerR (iron transport regulator)
MTKVDEKTLSVAAQWCACLRDPKGTTTAVERWLAWAEADELNLEAFEHIANLAIGLAGSMTAHDNNGRLSLRDARLHRADLFDLQSR